jgi:hypothetical protein
MDNLIRQFSGEIDEASETLGSGLYNKLSDLSKEMHDLERDKLVEIYYLELKPIQTNTYGNNIKIVIMKTTKKSYFPLSKIKRRHGDNIEESDVRLRMFRYSSILIGNDNLIIDPFMESEIFCIPDSGDNDCEDNDCDCNHVELKSPKNILLDWEFVN